MKFGVYSLDDFLCISTKDLVCLCQISLTCPNTCNYTKTGINWPSDGHDIWIRLHLMCNVGLNTVDDFFCVCAHYLGYLDLIYSTFPNAQIHKNRHNSTHRRALLLNEASFDVKCGVEHFAGRSVHFLHDFGYIFGSDFPNSPQCCKYTNTGITRPTDGLYTWVRLHLMWNVDFNTFNFGERSGKK